MGLDEMRYIRPRLLAQIGGGEPVEIFGLGGTHRENKFRQVVITCKGI